MAGIDARVVIDTRRLDAINAKAPDMAGASVKVMLDMTHRYIDEHWSGHYPPASSPGEPPAIRSGELKNSAKKVRLNTTTWALRYIKIYAEWMEYGSFTIKPRPFIRPAMAETKRQFKRVFAPDFRARLLSWGRR